MAIVKCARHESRSISSKTTPRGTSVRIAPVHISTSVALLIAGGSAVAAPMDRTCDQGTLRPPAYEDCEAKRLEEKAAETRAKASSLDIMARRANPKCDADADDPASLVGCNMGVKDMTTEAGFLRLEAQDLDAQAERHRRQAAALRAESNTNAR